MGKTLLPLHFEKSYAMIRINCGDISLHRKRKGCEEGAKKEKYAGGMQAYLVPFLWMKRGGQKL